MGHLPTSTATFRELLRFFIETHLRIDDGGGDPLSAAEVMMASATSDPYFPKLLRIMKSGLQAADARDSATGESLATDAGALGAVTQLAATIRGAELDPDVAEEIAASLAFVDPSLPDDEKAQRIRYLQAFLPGSGTTEELHRVVDTCDPSAFQTEVREACEALLNIDHPLLTSLPPTDRRLLPISLAFTILRIAERGGSEWLENL
jgi:hypothetical protein